MKPHEQADLFSAYPVAPEEAPAASKLDAFIAKHGGEARMRSTLMEMSPEERAKLIDAMAHIDNLVPSAVIERLGMHVADLHAVAPEAIQESAIEAGKQATPPVVEKLVDTDIPRREAKPVEAPVSTAESVEESAPAAVEQPAPAMPAPSDPEVDLAEAREDLADEFGRDPHSEKTKALLMSVAAKHRAASSSDVG